MSERDLVLVGGGHAHALLLRRLAMRPLPGVRVTLVSETGLTPYSGMLPGLIAGHYRSEDVHIDLNRLCRWAGARFIQGRVSGLDPDAKRLTITDQPDLAYDKVSFDTGSTPDLSVPGARSFAVGVKPVSRFHAKWLELLERADAGGHWGVVGAGAGGVELVLAMAHRLGPDSRVRLHLVHGGERILDGYPGRLVRAAEAALRRAGVELHARFRVSAVTKTGLVAVNGNVLDLDQTLWCTSAAPPDWPARSGLDTAGGGFIAVNHALQSTSHPDVFAAGDNAEMVFDPRPKAGVYAVRQAPFLYRNLKRAFAGRPLQPVRLQRSFLSLLSLGERRAVGHRGPLTFHGAWAWRWKDRIDRAFMNRFSNLGPPAAAMRPDEDEPAVMHCAGCGSKLGPAMLTETLDGLPRHQPDGLEPALGRAEDASLWQPTPGHRLVQSLDGFRSFSGDLYRFGRVSVLHALSDLYAMGARPVFAQVWVNLAHDHPRLQQRDYGRLMAGIARALHDENVALAGGHSTQGAETQVGIVANGELAPTAAWRKQGARPGDVLVLTKPLGTGVILAADMAAAAPAAALDAAWDAMLTSNGEAARVLAGRSPRAVTDITGFGLIGHLLEMLDDSTAARLDGEAIMALTGALALLDAGWQSSLVPQLLPYLHQCRFDPALPEARRRLLLDPQTSGGLLVALAPPDWEAVRPALPGATCIGRIEQRTPGAAAVVVDRAGPL